MASPTHEGETQKCSCGVTVTARMSKASENYPSKLQWQNDDGIPHYKKNMSTGGFDHVKPGQESTAENSSASVGLPQFNSNDTVRKAEEFYRLFLNNAGEIVKSIDPVSKREELMPQQIAVCNKLVDIALKITK